MKKIKIAMLCLSIMFLSACDYRDTVEEKAMVSYNECVSKNEKEYICRTYANTVLLVEYRGMEHY